MTKEQFFNFRVWFTISVTLVLSSLLLWQYFNGGIPSHNFLARKDMPLISNTWGALVVPFFTWLLLWRVNRRLFSQANTVPFPKNVMINFIAALAFGVILGLSIQFGFKTFSANVPIILFILALLVPTYRSEYFLGFVLGLTYFVGGVLPVIIGLIFLSISAPIHLYLRAFLIWLFKRFQKRDPSHQE